MRKPLLGLILLVALTLLVAPAALAEGPANAPVVRRFEVVAPEALPVQYGRVFGWKPVYDSLEAALANQPRQSLGGWNFWATVLEGAEVDGEIYYRTGYGWMHSDHVELSEGTDLRAIELEEYAGQRIAMVYWPEVDVYTAPERWRKGLGLLEGYDLVTILDEQWTNGELWYRIGRNRWVPSLYLRHIEASPRPAEVGPEEKWIEVNLSEQVLIAHQGDTPIFATLTATGKEPTPTVEGVFRIHTKYVTDRMMGGWDDNDPYDLADVPWTMYFHQNYALHSAYWHDLFGEVLSHGCINLSPVDALWLFEWSGPAMPEGAWEVKASEENPGTWVWVHS